MKGLKASVAVLAVSLAAVAVPAPGLAAHVSKARACCHVAAGTTVQVELVDRLSTKTVKTGDTFALQLAAPLIVNGEVVLRAGTLGAGEVVESAKPGMGGKPAKLVLAARYLEQGRVQVPLQALQLAAGGRSNATAAQVMGLGGMAFAPLGFVGFAVQGGDVVFPPGTKATATIAADASLRPLGRASRQMIADARLAAVDAAAPDTAGAIDIPPPPAGEGQVVFFRRKSILGVGQWIKVREGGRTLGKLNNGTYFVDVTTPGRHGYSATMEPELKDKLTLEVAAGQTVFVEGTLTKGLVVGAADLTPSARATFDKASPKLALAATSAGEESATVGDGSARGESAPNLAASGAASSAGAR